MIKHSLKDKVLHISIDNMDFSYRIPVKKTGNTVDWRIGEKGTEGIVVKNVSTWALQLFTKKPFEDKYIQQFKSIVQEYAPNSTINWDDTLVAIDAQNEYYSLVEANKTAEEENISILKSKYKFN